MRITETTSIITNRFDPIEMVQPIVIKIYACDDNGGEYQVGQLVGDAIHILQANESGHRMIDVLDSHGWEIIYNQLFTTKGVLRNELNFEFPIERFLLIYGIVLSPCLASVHCEVLEAIFESHPFQTLIGLSEVGDLISNDDLVALGFAKLARSEVLLRDNSLRSPFRQASSLEFFPALNPTLEDEEYVLQKASEYDVDLP